MENNTTVLYKNNTTVLEIDNILVLNVVMKFSERIRIARVHAKLTQEELALAVGLTQGLISKIERGDQEETASIVKIAKACKVRAEWLDDGTGNMLDDAYIYETTPEAKVLFAMQHMDDATKYQVVKISNSLIEPKANGTDK